jgi:uncharacterized protein (TIGR02300 family)
MVNLKFGQKHHCSACGTRFYDLNQTPATCPKCSTVSLAPSRPSEKSEQLEPSEPEVKNSKKEENFFESDPFEDTRELDDGEDLRSLSSADSALLEERN